MTETETITIKLNKNQISFILDGLSFFDNVSEEYSSFDGEYTLSNEECNELIDFLTEQL